jgi:lipid-A-disaccharide synthase
MERGTAPLPGGAGGIGHSRGSGPTIWFGAGDISGEENAARLATAIRELCPNARLIGAGGAAMRRAGVEVTVETAHLGFVGVLDAFRILPRLVRAFRDGQRTIEESRPDLVVLVDSEFVTMPAALWLRRRGVPVVFFYPPQVWLWGRWRLPAMVRLAKRFVSAFRAEAEIYRAAGADAVWVGHPLRDIVRAEGDGAAAVQAIGLDPARPLVALMPGSRRSEIQALVTPILDAARMLQQRDPRLQFAVPLASESLRAAVEEGVRRSGVRDVAVYRNDSYAVLSRASVAIQCSGTATLEAALLGIPSVIVYRCRPIEHFVGRRVMSVDFIGMANILLGEMVQPEFFDHRIEAAPLAEEAWSLLNDERRRRYVLKRLSTLKEILGPPGALERAAHAVLEVVPGWEASREMALTNGELNGAASVGVG